MRSGTYDVAVVGGGHNGLVAAGYLARAGLQVIVLERRERLGGPAAVREWLPGYRASVTNSPGSLEPKIVEDLRLAEHGLEFVRPDPTLVHPLSGGRLFVARRDPLLTAAMLDRLAPGESERYQTLFAYLTAFAQRLGITLWGPPPSLKELVRNLDSLEDQEAFSRVFLGTPTELCDIYLQSPEAKAIVATLATAGGSGSPSTPGLLLSMLMRPLSLATASEPTGYDPRRHNLRGSTGLPVGGMGAVVEAMAASARALGAVIRTEASVTHMLHDDNGVRGVVLDDGEVVHANAVVSALGPRQTAFSLMREDERWDPIRARLPHSPFKDAACKVVLAIDGLPRWAHDGDLSPAQLAAAQFRIAPTVDYLEQAYADCVKGRIPDGPVIWGLVPSVTSPQLAPEGAHVMSMNVGAPSALEDGDWERGATRMIDNCIDVLEEWLPDLRTRVLGARCMMPPEFERDYDLEDGDICYGPMLPGRMFWMRPAPGIHDYRTPTARLYISGAGAWPGNFFSGVPGHNAAQAVIHDLRAAQNGSGPVGVERSEGVS
jgi:phytoene dehydrogenase-like protein